VKKTLGIIGGMGAAAGVRLAEHLVLCAQRAGAKTDSDFPDFMLYNLPLVGMDETGIIDGAPVKRQLHEAFNRMNSWKCDYVIAACNTVHCFYQDMQSWCNGTVLNMVEIACDRTKETGSRKVGLLCSETTGKIGFYQEALCRRGIDPVLVTYDQQKVLNRAISAVIVGNGHAKHKLACAVEKVAWQLHGRGAEQIIVGCTELPMVLRPNAVPVSLIDAGAVAIEHALGLIS
jgi:aspartate racemase